MRRRSPTRTLHATIVTATVLVACTSSPSPPDDEPSPRATTPTTSASPTQTPAPTEAPEHETVRVTGRRVSIRPPHRGSFRVVGLYPWQASRCVDAEQPTLDGRYPGTLSIRADDGGTLTVVVTLEFQAYLEGIAEVPPTWPTAALEAQAIAARTYVLSRTGWSGEQGRELGTSICGTADCQVYGGIPRPRPPGLHRWYRAVRETRGQVLLSGDRPADTVYFSTSNGRTYGNEEVFGGSPLPYLRGVVERDDGASPTSRWRVELPARDLTTVLRAGGSWPRGAPITSVSVAGSTVRLAGGGQSRSIDAGSLRDAVNTWAPCLLPHRYPGDGLPVTIPSGWFDLSSSRRALVVEGRGWGHGVGMVQWGAYGKARRGWSAERILAFYYGGLEPKRYAEPGTVQVVVATGLRSITVKPSASGARLGGRTLARRPLRVTGGDEVTVTGTAPA
jgi:stage II sporulation protein D